jgi:alcohol dehydrogenase (NADP+)
MELHPYLQQQSFVDLHKKLGIQVTAYGPLGGTNPMYKERAARKDAPIPLLEHPVLKAIAKERGCTTAQVSIKWNMDRGIVVHPKSQRKDHQKENYDAWAKCKLTESDHQKIKDMEKTVSFRYWDICASQLGLPCYTGLERDD